jgi:(p)ppGpp synthase/HD superfamily hydrolase
MVDIVSKAIEVAANLHAGQVDKGGKPYILHCLHVMNDVDIDDPELAVIAVLHDVVEDTNAGVNMIAVRFGERVAYGVDALTKRKDELPDAYMERIKANPDAVKVKIADLAHNMNLTRIPNPTEKDFERCEKYEAMYGELMHHQLNQWGYK